MMSALLLSKKISHKKTVSDKVMEKLERFYQKWLGRALSRKAAIIGVSIALMLAAFAVLSQMGGEFIPELEEGDFAVETRIMTGSNLERSMEASKKAAALLKKNYPEVVKVVAKIGSGEIPTDPMPIEAQDLMVILKDKSEWTSAETFDELAEKMGKTLSEIPGVSFGFQFPVQMRFNELMTGARQDIVCKIYGENLDSLAALAAQLGSIAGTVEGAADIYVEPVGGLPQIVIRYNRQAIAAFGASISTINQAVNTAFAGQAGGLVFEGEKSFDLVVRMTKTKRNTLEDVADLLIPVADGKQVPLRQLAEVQVVEGPNQIQREDTKRRIIVGFNARGRDVQSIVEEIKKKTESERHMPAG
jgi:cobalt-zinc-cadmium resistance protein CzcA